MTENRQYIERIREELEAIYDGEVENEDGEVKTFWDYVAEETLDFTYTINSRREYAGCRLLIAFGGPNIYIDTIAKEIQLYWGGEEETTWLPTEIADEIDTVMEDMYNA
jgi:hypothetical protein